jgi:hypothetical protein
VTTECWNIRTGAASTEYFGWREAKCLKNYEDFFSYASHFVLKYKEMNNNITIENAFCIQSVFTATCFDHAGSSWLYEHIKRSTHIAQLEVISDFYKYIHSSCLSLINSTFV